MLHVGDLEPKEISIAVSDPSFDFTAVTDADIYCEKPDGTELVLAGTLTNVTVTECTVVYVLDSSTSELDVAGGWNIYVDFTYPSGHERTNTMLLLVAGQYEYT